VRQPQLPRLRSRQGKAAIAIAALHMAVIWIIDAEQWPRALLRAELIERGFDAVGYITVRDAIESLPERPPDLIVVDLRGQPVPQVERLRAIGVPMVIVAGVPEINEIASEGWTVMRRPVSIGEIADEVSSRSRSAPP
jgi:DNA-binding NtrC family response regulator